MDFQLSDELEAVRDLARTILSEQSHPDRLAALEAAGDWFDRATWQALAEAGLLAAPLPAAHGGSDLGWLAVHLLLEAVGEHVAKVPMLETLGIGAFALANFAPEAVSADLLAGVTTGTTLLTVALAEDGWTDPRAPASVATRTDEGWSVSGTKHLVPLATLADHVLVSARGDTGAIVLVVDRAAVDVDVVEQAVIGDVPHGDLVLTDVAVADDHVLADGALEWLVEHAAAGVSSLQAGICTAAVRMAASYTSEREQFGRPIATFQAVSQRVADAHIDAEAVRLTALEAAWRLHEGLPAAEAVAVAKWWACEAGHRVVHAAHHVHGGVSVDRDYPLFRHTLRTKQLEHTHGSAPVHLGAIGRAIAADG